MLVQLKEPVPDSDLAELRTGLKAAVAELDQHDDLFYKDGPLIRIEAGDWKTTGDPFPVGHASNGADWLNINFCRAVYQPGYERGHLQLYIKAAEWLEDHLPGVQIWYGNDETGEPNPFGPKERLLLKKYWDRFGHRPYASHIRETSSELDEARTEYNAEIKRWLKRPS